MAMKRLIAFILLPVLSLNLFFCMPVHSDIGTSSQPASAEEWFPFTVPWDDEDDNVTHAGKLLLDAPAGKHGFLKIMDGHFFFEDGTRIRFWGTNLSAGANFPSHNDAEKIAAHLAKSGFNIIRFHHMDSSYAPRGIFDKSNGDTMTLSPEQLDRLDYLIFQLKQRGIYADLNLHVGRKFTSRDGVEDARNLPRNSKQVTMFDEKLIELQKDYANKLLTHYNPYTQSSYNDEPCIALVETTNENTLFSAWNNGALFGQTDEALPEYYMNELDQKWNEWLKQKYQNAEALKSAWGVGEKLQGSNLVKNPDFETDIKENWVQEVHKGAKAGFSVDPMEKASGEYSLRADLEQVSGEGYFVQFKQLGIRLQKNKNYELSFKARSDKEREISVSFGMEKSPWTNYGLGQTVALGQKWEQYRILFTANADTDDNTRLSFILGKTAGTVWLDDVSLSETGIAGLKGNESLDDGTVERTKWTERMAYTGQRVADNTEFYYQLEDKYFKDMLDYIHNGLGIKVPVSTTNNYYGQPNLMSQNEGDYIDAHGYWDHPGFPAVRFDRKNFTQRNLSMIRNTTYTYNPTIAYNSSPLIRFSLSAVKDKPMVISEWNDVFPNDYDYEEAAVLAAYALLQDWDGLFIYTFHSDSDKWDTDYINSWFDVVNNPGKMSQMPSCAAAFIRGDFKPAGKEVLLGYSKNDVIGNYRNEGGRVDYNIKGSLPLNTVFAHKIRKTGFDEGQTSALEDVMSSGDLKTLTENKIIKSDTGEITWNGEDKENEYVTFNSPRFQGAAGFIKDRQVELDNLKLKLSTNCSATITSMDGKDIGISGDMLLTLVARQKNTGQQKEDRKNGLLDWGKKPVIMEPVNGIVEIKAGTDAWKYSVYSLDSKGNRVSKIPLEYSDTGISFNVGGDAATWYEITQ